MELRTDAVLRTDRKDCVGVRLPTGLEEPWLEAGMARVRVAGLGVGDPGASLGLAALLGVCSCVAAGRDGAVFDVAAGRRS